jgi:hypothetical protein
MASFEMPELHSSILKGKTNCEIKTKQNKTNKPQNKNQKHINHHHFTHKP